MNNQTLTGAPAPLTLGGRTYQMSPLTDKAIVSLDSWVRSQHIKTAMNAFPKDQPQEVRDDYIRVAQNQATQLTFLSSYGAAAMGTVEGLSQILFQMGKVNHPKMAPEDWAELLVSEEAINNANSVFVDVHGMGGRESSNEKKPDRNRKRAERKRQRKNRRNGRKDTK